MRMVGHVEDVHTDFPVGTVLQAGGKQQGAVVERALVAGRIDVTLDPKPAAVALLPNESRVAPVPLGGAAAVDLGFGHPALDPGFGHGLAVAGNLWRGAVIGRAGGL